MAGNRFKIARIERKREMKYDIDYFIAKFEGIPEDKWCTGDYEDSHGRHCALGHCGGSLFSARTKEEESLFSILGKVGMINDGKIGYDQFGDHPKKRILSALSKAKEGTLN